MDSREDFQAQAIRTLKNLKKLNRLPTVDAWRAATHTNLAKQSGLSGQQSGLNGLSQLEREKVNNPIFHKFDARSTSSNVESNLGLQDDQNAAIVVITEALQELNATYLQDRALLSQRVSDLTLAVDNLLKQTRGTQSSIPSQALQVQINSLNNLLTAHTADCGKQNSLQTPVSSSTGAFYSFRNLNEVFSLLKGFISSYRLYRATVGDWATTAGTRVTRTSGSESSSTKKLFKKLVRTGNIFRDTLQNGIALNQIFGALNSNSKVIKEFHPNKETFRPIDYAKEAGRIFGTVVDGDSLKYTQKTTHFIQK